MSVLYVVRHAHSDWGPSEDRPLSERGWLGAQRVCELLAPLEPGAIHSSPARRALQTTEPLARRLGLTMVQEVDLGERRLAPNTVPDFEAAVRATWFDFGFALPGGESNRAAQARVLAVLRRIVATHAGAPVVVSTHGNLLALALNAIDRAVGFEFWQGLSFPDVFRVDFGESLQRASFERLWRPGP